MADPRHDPHAPGADGGSETTGRWIHRHGASDQRVADHVGDPDPELSFTGVAWTAGGIAAITVVAMVLMFWMLGGLTDYLTAREPVPTPAEIESREAVRRAGEDRLATEVVPSPGLAVPADLEMPPGPRLEVDPTWNLRQLRKAESKLLDEWAEVDEPAGSVRIPIDTAIELAAAGELPGVPRGTPGPAVAVPAAAAVLRPAGESAPGTDAVAPEPGEEPDARN